MIYGEKSPSIREVMDALEDEHGWMELVRDDEKSYVKLIDVLLSEPARVRGSVSESRKRKTVACYADLLGTKPATITRWFRQLYVDIFNLNEEHPELFVNPGEQLCAFSYYSKSEGSGFWFNLGVKSIPRIGERVGFYFPKAVTDTSEFVVKDVIHRYEKGLMEIEVELGCQYYSGRSYRDLLVDKALFFDLISDGDAVGPDYELDEKLKGAFNSRGKFEYI